MITCNEAENLQACVQTLDFCAEVIVVDHGSTDGTPELARQLGCKVVITADWPGFGLQKQRALDHAANDWILSIDADERISETLKQEILGVVNSENPKQGYIIERQTFFLGRAMRHGGWYPDPLLRLARRTNARFEPVLVHEKLIVHGDVGKLKGHLLHYSYRTLNQVLDKQAQYALLGARERASNGRRYGLIMSLVKSGWTFFRHYVLLLGVLDGREGALAAIAKAQETFWKCAATRYVLSDTSIRHRG